jgi:uncharacterized membrane protein
LGVLAILLSFTMLKLRYNLPFSFLPGFASLLLGVFATIIANKLLDSTKIEQDSSLNGIFDNLNNDENMKIFGDTANTSEE